MPQEIQNTLPNETQLGDPGAPPPFTPNQGPFCRFESIEKRIDEVRVLVVDDLLRDEHDISDVARSEWGSTAASHLKRERQIAGMAIENIVSNIERLVKRPTTKVIHVSELAHGCSRVQA